MQKSEKLKKIYERIPKIDCKRLCHDACGPIAMSKLEYKILLEESGKSSLAVSTSLSCPLLKDLSCSVYHNRPAICRLWGVVDAPYMRCPYGCIPERWLTDKESRSIIAEINKISNGEMEVVTLEE